MEILARLIGVFYVVGGLFVVRVMVMDALMDRMLAGITAGKVPTKDRVRAVLLLTGAVLTALSGLALVMLSAWSTVLFAANVAVQGAWLLIAAKWFRPDDASEAKGRSRTTNAFLGYLAASALVAHLWNTGKLGPWMDPAALSVLGLVTIGLVAWIARGLWLPTPKAALPSADELGDWSDAAPADMEIAPPPPIERLRIAPELGCWPLWDDETGRNCDHLSMDLPTDLAMAIETWDLAFQDDPEMSAVFPAELIERLKAIYGADKVVCRLVDYSVTSAE